MCNMCVHVWLISLTGERWLWEQAAKGDTEGVQVVWAHHLTNSITYLHSQTSDTPPVEPRQMFFPASPWGTSKAFINQGRGATRVCFASTGLNSISCASESYQHKGPLSVPIYVSQRCQQRTDVYTHSIHGVAVADSDLVCVLFFKKCEVCPSDTTYVWHVCQHGVCLRLASRAANCWSASGHSRQTDPKAVVPAGQPPQLLNPQADRG